MSSRPSLLQRLHEVVTNESSKANRSELSKEARAHQSRNFFTHVLSLSATKSGDSLVNPKLVLAWLMGAIGAPIMAVGLLVPIRESLALLPQLVTAPWIQRLRKRKFAWVAGSAVQGLAALAIAFSAARLEGSAAGWTIVALLAVFALARSLCSVSYKDVLGRTVAKAQRGTATGFAGSLSACVALALGLSIRFGWLPLTVSSIATVVGCGGLLWLFAASLFASVAEAAEEPDAVSGADRPFRAQMDLLKSDPQLRIFIAARGFLTATALAPPYIVAIGGGESGRLANLGPFVAASALASLGSSYLWGRLADRSSRKTLIASAILAALSLGATALIASFRADLLAGDALLPLLLLVLMTAYEGVRLSRSTHVVDMAPEDQRASYAALSNTAIGLILLAGGGFGWLASLWGNPAVLCLFALSSLAAVGFAWKLRELQRPSGG